MLTRPFWRRRSACRALPLPLCRSMLLLLALAVGQGSTPQVGWAGATSWTSQGPDMGWVRDLILPFGAESFLYAAAYGGGVFRSGDGGRSWEDVSGNLTGLGLRRLALADDGFLTLYAGSEDGGLQRSTALGTRWNGANAGLGVGFLPIVTGIAIHPDDPFTLSLSTSDGVYSSHDRGSSWPDSLHWIPATTFEDVATSPLAPHAIYALGSFQLFYSPDLRGRSYQVVSQGLPDDLLMDLELWPSNPDSLFVVSLDAGAFRRLGSAPFEFMGPQSAAGPQPRLYVIKALGERRELLLGGSDGLRLSEDVGVSWQPVQAGLAGQAADVWSIVAEDPVARTLLLGSFTRGFLRSAAGGGSWAVHNEGLRAAWVHGLYARAGELLAATAHGRLFHSGDGGASWDDASGDLDVLQLHNAWITAGERWLVSSSFGLWSSDDHGAHWRLPTTPPATSACGALLGISWLEPPALLLATAAGVAVSRDEGEHWAELPGLGNDAIAYGVLAASEVDSTVWLGSRGDGLYAGRWGGPYVPVAAGRELGLAVRGLAVVNGGARQGLQRSVGASPDTVLVGTATSFFALIRQGDGSWMAEVRGGGLPLSAPGVSELTSLALDPSGGELFAGFSQGGVYRSADQGRSWSPWSTGLPQLEVEGLALDDASSPPQLHAATLARGVWSRRVGGSVPVLLEGPTAEALDAGVSLRFRLASRFRVEILRQVDGGPPATVRAADAPALVGPVEILDAWGPWRARAHRELRYLLRLWRDGSVVSTSATVLTLASQAPSLPVRPRLLPNIPNPFNPRTRIPVELAEAGGVRVDVYDARGRWVIALWRGPMAVGRHELEWNGNDSQGRPMPSGVYRVLLRQGAARATSSITLIR